MNYIIACAAIIIAFIIGIELGEPGKKVTQVPSEFCNTKMTGQNKTVEWEECVHVGKNSCGSKRKRSKVVEEALHECRFVTWENRK